jgi:predicted glycosyltransferase involved in capsule biosynthesis
MKRRANVDLISDHFYSGQINNSLLRNRALKLVKTPVSMLLDADLFPDQALFFKCAQRVLRGDSPLIILPCLYLSKMGSQWLLSGKESRESLVHRYLAFERAPFLHIASPSSAIFFRTEEYWRIGGFDEAYVGHGYEDFDFMLRLAIEHKLIEPAPDMLDGETCRSPILATGFRKYLGRLSLPHLLNKEIVFHLYHRKIHQENYYQLRKANFLRFQKKHQSLVTMGNSSKLLTGLEIDFFKLCNDRNLSPRDYSILLDNRPGYVDRLDSIGKRIKFLLGN